MTAALHPVGMLATTAQGTLAIPELPDAKNGSERARLAADWVRRFYEEPMRTGDRRYYDNCLYVFAWLALAGKYRIW